MTATDQVHPSRTRAGRMLAPVAVATLFAALALDAVDVWRGGSTDAGPRISDFLLVAAVTVVAAVVVFGMVLPRNIGAPTAGPTALVLGVLALLAVPVFWLGIAGVLGVGAVLLGLESTHAEHGAWLARLGSALGAVGAVGYVLMYVLDWVEATTA
jgi:hypothetical protein